MAVSRLQSTNAASSTLASSITNVATSVALSPGTGALFPPLTYAGDFFMAALVNTAGQMELVKVTARSTDTLTVVRAQEGTTARSYSGGDRLELRLTAAGLASIMATAWVRDTLTPTYASASSFTLSGDQTGTYVANRALYLRQTSSASGFVTTSSYGGGNTTVNVTGCTVDAGLTSVEYGQEPASAPKYATVLPAVSSGDTTPNYLASKILAGPGISVTKENAGGNEDLKIANIANLSSVATNQAVHAAQNSICYIATAAINLTLDATSSLGANFFMTVYAFGGAVTVVPNGTDKIDNVNSNFVIPQGGTCDFISDGAGNMWPFLGETLGKSKTWSYQQLPYTATLASSSATTAFDNKYMRHTGTMTESTTLGDPANKVDGQAGRIILIGHSTNTLSVHTNWRMASGASVSLSPADSKRTVIDWECNGTYNLITNVIQEA